MGRVAAVSTITVMVAARVAGGGLVAVMGADGNRTGCPAWLSAWRARLLRRAGLDHNPLRRRLDRVQAVLRAGLLAVFVIGGPIATVCVSHGMYDAEVRAEWAQAATWHRVPAVVVHSISVEAAAWRHPGQPATFLVQWVTPGGQVRRGEITGGKSLAAGSTVTIWVGAQGRLTHRPLTRADVVVRVIGAVVLTPALLALVLCAVGGAAALVLDRCRLAAWEADWLVVEPEWSRRR